MNRIRMKFVIAITLCVFAFPTIMMSQGTHLGMYEIADSCTFEEFSNNLKDKTFQETFRGDTYAYFDGKDDSKATIKYSPKSKIVSSFSYQWFYKNPIDKETSGNAKYDQVWLSNFYLVESGKYFFEVVKVLQNRYGVPTSLMIDNNPTSNPNWKEVTNKAIDSLTIANYVDRPSRFKVNWKDSKKEVSITYYNDGGIVSNSKILYDYVNNNNLKINEEELESINTNNLFSRIVKWIIFAIILIVVLYAIIKIASNNEKIAKVIIKLIGAIGIGICLGCGIGLGLKSLYYILPIVLVLLIAFSIWVNTQNDNDENEITVELFIKFFIMISVIIIILVGIGSCFHKRHDLRQQRIEMGLPMY